MDTLDELEPGTPHRRRYWAQRHGAEGGRITPEAACRLFRSFIAGLVQEGYFQEWFGYECVDAGTVVGLAGPDVGAFVFRKTRLDDLWPLSELWLAWDKLHLLTAIEFLHDHVSKPTKGRFHGWDNCGWHYNVFDRAEGRALYRAEVNDILGDIADRTDRPTPPLVLPRPTSAIA